MGFSRNTEGAFRFSPRPPKASSRFFQGVHRFEVSFHVFSFSVFFYLAFFHFFVFHSRRFAFFFVQVFYYRRSAFFFIRLVFRFRCFKRFQDRSMFVFSPLIHIFGRAVFSFWENKIIEVANRLFTSRQRLRGRFTGLRFFTVEKTLSSPFSPAETAAIRKRPGAFNLEKSPRRRRVLFI
ncbi:MAG: hypothetical protein LBR53_07545 [Deltaproteobacteria bacterium]|jgi:hypothetical protein|nr:hypothetical protein [Deltaproteobacteria bacterium]